MKKPKKIAIIVLAILAVLVAGIFYEISIPITEYDIGESGVVFGSENAPVVMMLYTSFTCENCKKLNEQTHAVVKQFIDDGTLRLVYKPTNDAFYLSEGDIIRDYDELLKCYDELVVTGRANNHNLSIYNAIQDELDTYQIDTLPTFFLNGERYVGAYTAEELSAMVNTVASAGKVYS